MPKPFIVSLVGTKDDLFDLREDIKANLSKKGYSVFAFDEANYPYMPGRDPSKNTVDLATHPDILTLILDKRYGSRLKNRLSVSENELKNAEKNKLPIIVCIRKEAVDEFKQWESSGKITSWKTRYVDDVDLLKLIEHVRKSTFCLEFNTLVDLRDKLDEKMKSLTPFILRKVAEKSHTIARNKRTITIIDKYLSMGDVFDKNLFVTPPYHLASGALPEDSLENNVVTSLKRQQNLIITGRPGAGKSTVLIKSLLLRSHDMKTDTLLAPIYVDCRALLSKDFLTVESFIGRLFELVLDKNMWPHFDQNDPNIEIELFLDALDEVRNGSASLQQTIAGSPLWGWEHHILACRQDFLSRIFTDSGFSSHFQYIAELQLWNDKNVQLYIERKFSKDKINATNITKAIAKSDTIRDLASNVIGLVMLCSLSDISMIDNPATLYREFLLSWIARETQRANAPKEDIELVLSTWRYIAWRILVGGENTGIEYTALPNIFEEYDKRRQIVESPIIQSLLVNLSKNDKQVILGFIHASIYEYLIAEEVIQRLQSSFYLASEALEQDTWYEVNEFTQQMTSKWDDAKCIQTIQNLIEVYQRHSTDNYAKGLLLRNKACYYIGRLGRQSRAASISAFDFLNKTWRDEQSIFVRQSIGFARSIAGLPGAAKEFIIEMQANSELDSLNRGYHLAYYGDIEGHSPPYRDSEQKSWQQTRKAIVSRLKHESDAKRNGRLVDLYTFHRFLTDRNENPDVEEVKIIRSILDNLGSYTKEVQPLIEKECDAIIKLAR